MRFLKTNKVLSAAVIATVGMLSVGSANDAEAAFAMRLTQGATIVTVADGGLGDFAAATPGAILHFGPVGIFNINIDTGLSNPVLAAPYPHMDLSVTATSTGAGTLVVELSQTGFSNSGVQNFNTHWGPVVGAGGTSSLEIFVDLADNLFGGGTKVADLGPVSSPGAFFGVSGLAPTDPSYSVTLRWTITHTLAGSPTTGNAEFQIPEPGTLALFGVGLLGLGFLSRRRSAMQEST